MRVRVRVCVHVRVRVRERVRVRVQVCVHVHVQVQVQVCVWEQVRVPVGDHLGSAIESWPINAAPGRLHDRVVQPSTKSYKV